MYSFADLNIATRAQLMNVFTPANYCFATTTNNRSPTFYFATGGLAALNHGAPCGRIRTCHNQGPLIDITQQQKRHMFFQTVAARSLAYQTLHAGLQQVAFNAFIAQQRVVPQNNDSHLEVTMAPAHGRPYSRTHPSGGAVTLNPRIVSQNQITNLLDLLFRERAPVQINRAPLPIPVPGVAAAPHVPVPNIVNFIAML